LIRLIHCDAITWIRSFWIVLFFLHPPEIVFRCESIHEIQANQFRRGNWSRRENLKIVILSKSISAAPPNISTMLTDVPGMLTRAGLYPHSQPTAAVIHDKSVSPFFLFYLFKLQFCRRLLYSTRWLFKWGTKSSNRRPFLFFAQ
jgi:hypothetical protein